MSHRTFNVAQIAAIFVGLLIGIAIASRVSPATGATDPIVTADHAERSIGDPVVLPPPPQTILIPSRLTEARAWLHNAGQWTGGAWLAAAVALALRKGRQRWPSWRRGWRDHVTGGGLGATLWIAGSLATGATLGVALFGVVMAAATGAAIGADPGEKQPAKGEAVEA